MRHSYALGAVVCLVAVQGAADEQHRHEGEQLGTNESIRRYLLRSAGLAAVQFQAFGSNEEDGWFRLSVGAVSVADIEAMVPRLRTALKSVTD